MGALTTARRRRSSKQTPWALPTAGKWTFGSRPMLYGTVRGRPGLSPYVAWDTCGRHVVVALRDVLLLMGRVWWKVALGACHVGRALQYLWHLGTCARWVVAPTSFTHLSSRAAWY